MCHEAYDKMSNVTIRNRPKAEIRVFRLTPHLESNLKGNK